MRITVIDINGENHTVHGTDFELDCDTLLVKDALNRPKAVFIRDKIIGFEVDR